MTAATASPAPAAATAEKPPIVEVRSVSKVYVGGVEALSAVSLDFREGQLTALLGPTGCGKTTLLKIVAGLIPGTSGEVRIKGRSVTGPGPERSFVFQDFALLPWATVLRNAAFGLELRGMPRVRREAAAQAHRQGWSRRFRAPVSTRVVGRHAPARRLGARWPWMPRSS